MTRFCNIDSSNLFARTSDEYETTLYRRGSNGSKGQKESGQQRPTLAGSPKGPIDLSFSSGVGSTSSSSSSSFHPSIYAVLDRDKESQLGHGLGSTSSIASSVTSSIASSGASSYFSSTSVLTPYSYANSKLFPPLREPPISHKNKNSV